MTSEEDKEETIIYDTEDGYIQSLDDLAAQSVIDETETRPEVKHKESLPAAPDGGYAWVICCGVFVNHMIFEGLGRAEGLFFLQFQSKFGTTAQMAAWPSSLMSTVKLFMGPACGIVANRYSVRTASIIGTCLCFAGMLLNSFAPSIYFLFLSHTLLGGLGRGLMSGVLVLNLYFDKHRSLATGLGSSGIGFGSLWTVPLVQFLFDEYGFTGAFMIMSGLLLHGLLIAMLYRPLRMHYRFMTAKLLRKGLKTTQNEYNVNMSSNKTATSDSNNQYSNLAETELKKQDKLLTIDENAEQPEKSEQAESAPLLEDTIDENAEQPEKSEQAESVPLLEDTSTAPRDDRPSLSSKTSSTDDDKDIFRANETEKTQPESNTKENMVSVEKKTDSDGCLSSSLKVCFPIEFKREEGTQTVKVFHWELLRHVPFIVYCTASLLFLLANKTAFVFLPAVSMSKGLSRQQAALLLTITGALDTFGRIATGFIMDLRPMRRFRRYFFNMLLFFIAVDTLMIPFISTFTSFSIVCAFYGFLTGSFTAQKMVVLIDILGREKMTSCLGILKVFQGVGTLIGPPLAGALRDALGNYDSSFYLGGASMIGSALLMTLSGVLLKFRNRKSAM